MKVVRLILITFTAFTQCAINHAKPVNTRNTDTLKQTMPAADSLSYIALGDSYTIGEAVPQNESFPYQLTALLNTKLYTRCRTQNNSRYRVDYRQSHSRR